VKICCVSDLHGFLPKIPNCDLLLIGGDIVPTDAHDPADSIYWLENTFSHWLSKISNRMKVVGVAGNHDFIFEHSPECVPAMMDWEYLQDSGLEFNGYKIWGSPWQPRFFDWAFNLDEEDLVKKWSMIPDDTDILLLHGPPNGYGDFSVYGNVHTGSPGLLSRIEEVKPKLVVAGHIHSGYGVYNIGETVFINASHVDEKYRPSNNPVIVNI